MTPLKVLLGIGLACAACCALPLAGTVLASAAGALLLARLDAALALLALALLAGGLVWRHRRRARPRSCDCTEVCTTACTPRA